MNFFLLDNHDLVIKLQKISLMSSLRKAQFWLEQLVQIVKPKVQIRNHKSKNQKILVKKKTPHGGTLSQLEGGGGNKLQDVPT